MGQSKMAYADFKFDPLATATGNRKKPFTHIDIDE